MTNTNFHVPERFARMSLEGQKTVDDYTRWIEASGATSRLGIFYRAARDEYEGEKGRVSAAEYAKRIDAFLTECPPVVVTSEDVDDVEALARLVASKPKSIVCLDTTDRLKWALYDAEIRVHAVTSDYNIPFTPPFQNEGSRTPADFEGCVVMFPSGNEAHPETLPDMAFQIVDPAEAGAFRQAAEAYVRTNCTWRELVSDLVKNSQ